MNPVGQAHAWLDGLNDSRKEFGGVLLWSAVEAEGEVSFSRDMKMLAEEGFLP